MLPKRLADSCAQRGCIILLTLPKWQDANPNSVRAMSRYLETYGAREERREKFVKRLGLLLALLLLFGSTVYLLLRNYRETQQVKLFLELLRKQEFAAAYKLWGCTKSSPCSDYSMDRFLEDWGPKSTHADSSMSKITKTRGCATGVTVEAEFDKGPREYLWVDRQSRRIGFAPYAPYLVCNPKLSPQTATVSLK
jgi:hypothetical protein